MDTYESDLVDQVLTEMLWSRLDAAVVRNGLHISAFAGRAALAALIDSHDQNEANSARDGMERVQSITRSIINRAAHVRRNRDAHAAWLLGRRTGPEPINPYSPAISMIAYRDGAPDPLLLTRATQVLTYLPLLVAPDSPRRSYANISRLVHQLAALQTYPARCSAADSQNRVPSTGPRRARPGRLTRGARKHPGAARISVRRRPRVLAR
jgi:hypothetical protein